MHMHLQQMKLVARGSYCSLTFPIIISVQHDCNVLYQSNGRQGPEYDAGSAKDVRLAGRMLEGGGIHIQTCTQPVSNLGYSSRVSEFSIKDSTERRNKAG